MVLTGGMHQFVHVCRNDARDVKSITPVLMECQCSPLIVLSRTPVITSPTDLIVDNTTAVILCKADVTEDDKPSLIWYFDDTPNTILTAPTNIGKNRGIYALYQHTL